MHTVSAERAFEHVDRLLSEHPGLTRNHVFRLAGVTNVMRADRRRRGRITPETEERLLAVTDRHLRLLPPRHVPRQPVLAHIDRLLEVGDHVSLSSIGKTAGISYQTMYNLRSGASETCRWSTHLALMAVTPEMVDKHAALRPCTPTITRLRALEANGWSRSVLDEMLGLVIVSQVVNRARWVMPATEEAVKRLYEQIGDTPGPSTSARNHARRLGYKPPIYYDEDMNLIEVGGASAEERSQHEARLDLCILGQTIEHKAVGQIAKSLGVTDRRIGATRRRYGLVIERDFAGLYKAAERVPGAIAAIRDAVRGLHYRSTLDLLDDEGVDYVDRLASVREVCSELVAA